MPHPVLFTLLMIAMIFIAVVVGEWIGYRSGIRDASLRYEKNVKPSYSGWGSEKEDYKISDQHDGK